MKFCWWISFSFVWVCLSLEAPFASNATVPPICVKSCFIDVVLGEGRCDLNQITQCLCPNIPIQHNLSICVRVSCNLEDQGRAIDEQAKLCAGYPQESRRDYVLKVGITFFVITMIILGLRLFTRYSNTGKLWADDWVALVAGVCLIFVAGLQIHVCSIGFGKHIWQVPVAHGLQLIKPFFALQFLYIAVQVLAKISLLFVYRRIYPSKKFQHICNIGIAFIALHGIAFTFAVLFQCRPISDSWKPTLIKHCLNAPAIGFAGAGFSILEDLVIIFMPLPQLIRLQIKTAQKIALIFMFSIGSFACITSIVRLKYLSTFENSTDLTWENTDILVWSVLEIEVTVICACLPTLRPLFIDIIPGFYRSVSTGTTNSRIINNVIKPSTDSVIRTHYNYLRSWLRFKNSPSRVIVDSPVCEKSWSPEPV